MGISFGGINGIADQSMSTPAGAGKGGASQPGIYNMPAQNVPMQAQQYAQIPYAQQYAQQGNINDPTVFAALQALNAPAFVSQPTQRYGSGIMEQPSGGGKGGVGQGNAPMIQDWRTMRDQIAARTQGVPTLMMPTEQTFSDSGGYDTGASGFGGFGTGGFGPANDFGDLGNPVEFGGYDFGGYDGSNVNGGYGAGGYGSGDNFGGFDTGGYGGTDSGGTDSGGTDSGDSDSGGW